MLIAPLKSRRHVYIEKKNTYKEFNSKTSNTKITRSHLEKDAGLRRYCVNTFIVLGKRYRNELIPHERQIHHKATD